MDMLGINESLDGWIKQVPVVTAVERSCFEERR